MFVLWRSKVAAELRAFAERTEMARAFKCSNPNENNINKNIIFKKR